VSGRPAVFLDRDGTLIEDRGYLRDPDQVALLPGASGAVRRLDLAGLPVVVVTNQSGIARGYFGWDAFARVNGRVLDLLGEKNAFVDMVLACAYHEAGAGPLAVADHPMRKPNPGMLLEAGRRLELDLKRSLIVGDKPADMEAGQRAGLKRGWLVEGGGSTMGGLSVVPLRDALDLDGLLSAIRSL
jgi:D-glycero-D-manno-heptose 1,7-bisphosphate phosphatase